MKKHFIIMVVGMAFLTILMPCLGKVFWKRRPSAGNAIVEFATDWNRVFHSNIRINGSHGKMDILGCDADLNSVMRRLRHGYASAVKLTEFQQNDSMGWGIIHANGRISRVLVLGIEPSDRSIVFTVTQRPSDYEKSLHPATSWPLQEIPVYPGSLVQSSIVIEETNSRLEVSIAPGPPGPVHSFFQSALLGNGWKQRVTPLDSITEYSGLTVYQKGFEICCVLIQASGRSQESIITVLHKRLSVE